MAYAIYKNAKREWIQEFRRNNGRRPNEEECRSHSAAQTNSTLTAYVSQADQILADYAADVINAERPKILDDALKGSFWRSFWPSFFSSVAFTALLVVLVIIAALLGVGLPMQITIPAHQAAQSVETPKPPVEASPSPAQSIPPKPAQSISAKPAAKARANAPL